MKSFEEMLALTSDVESVFGAEEHGGLIEGTENLPTVHELMSTAVRVADIVELRDVAQKLECGAGQPWELSRHSRKLLRAAVPQ